MQVFMQSYVSELNYFINHLFKGILIFSRNEFATHHRQDEDQSLRYVHSHTRHPAPDTFRRFGWPQGRSINEQNVRYLFILPLQDWSKVPLKRLLLLGGRLRGLHNSAEAVHGHSAAKGRLHQAGQDRGGFQEFLRGSEAQREQVLLLPRRHQGCGNGNPGRNVQATVVGHASREGW